MVVENKSIAGIGTEQETYQGSVSPHNVMVKHINQVLAAEYKHGLEYQQEQQQIETERRIRHKQERATQQTNQQTALEVQTAETGDSMNLKQITVAALTAASLATATIGVAGCSDEKLVTQQNTDKVFLNGDGFDITKNPDAKQAYKLKVKVKDAPGKFKVAEAGTTFGIKNTKDCGYTVDALQETVTHVQRFINFPLTQTSDTEFEGVFYTDWGKDGDFFGRGVCHWEFESAGAYLRATGADGESSFGLGFSNYGSAVDEQFEQNKSLTRFYRKAIYPINPIMENAKDFGFTETVAKQQHKPNDIFSISITVEKIKQ